MFSQAAETKINAYSNELIVSNDFLKLARLGKISKQQVADYAYNLQYVLGMTPVCLRLARDVSISRGENELAEFFSEKIIEEQGHDEWAKNDIHSLGFVSDSIEDDKINSEVVQLMIYIRKAIQEDPRKYLIYMLFVEQLTVKVAPDLLESLDKYCGIPRTQITAISNHEELDREHVKDDLKVINRFIGNPDDASQFFSVIDFSFQKVNQFLIDVARSENSVWS